MPMPTVFCALLLATEVDQVGGNAGWVGAGLLGAVLTWLMFKHLPDKDRQVNDLIKRKDESVAAVMVLNESQRKEYTLTLLAMTADFRAEAGAERIACEKHYATLATSMQTAFTTLGEQLRASGEQVRLHSERNQQWLQLLKEQIEKERAKQNLPPENTRTEVS